MKRSILAILLSLSILSSCRINHESFIHNLANNQDILRDSTLKGWDATSRVGDYSGYILRWYDLDYSCQYLNYHVLKDGSNGYYDYKIDTLSVCNLFNIQQEDIDSYFATICRKLWVLTQGYNIDVISFNHEGYCFFFSIKNGWEVVYKKLDDDTNECRKIINLDSLGFHRYNDTPFWYKEVNPL